MRHSWILALIGGLVLASCTPVSDPDGTGTMRSFASDSELGAFARRAAAAEKAAMEQWESGEVYAEAAMADAPATLEVALPAESSADSTVQRAGSPESITNVQEAGVDEGGIVKNTGDFLVVLRRGKLFSIRHGDDALVPVDSIDVFAPDDEEPDDAWYDEMLFHNGVVVIIGYSYGGQGTEVSRFDLSEAGELSYRDTHYFRSDDYYSSRNYASRLIGSELILYAPVAVDWNNWRGTLPSMRTRQQMLESAEPTRLVDAEEIYLPEPYWGNDMPAFTVAHTVTRCDISQPELACEASSVIGSYSRNFYVASDAVYIWTEMSAPGEEGLDQQLHRLPLDGTIPGAVAVKGSPVDQFSFKEFADEGVLRVVVRADGGGDAMWRSEVTSGDVSLLTVPLDDFANGSSAMPETAYRNMPKVEGYNFQNRYVGDYVLYAASSYNGREAGDNYLYVQPIEDAAAAIEVKLPHSISRLDRLLQDGMAIGQNVDGALGFSAIELGQSNPSATLGSTFLFPDSAEGEQRSQAFFFRPDRGSTDSADGTIGLPISRPTRMQGGQYVSGGAGIQYLRRDNKVLSTAGVLNASVGRRLNDGCQASCVDWYGNARPIFLGDRVFALMGYDLVEGSLNGGRIRERRRVDFTPAVTSRRSGG